MPKWMESMLVIDGDSVHLSRDEPPTTSVRELRCLLNMYKARALALDKREKDLHCCLKTEKDNSKELGKQLRSSNSKMEKLMTDLEETKLKNIELERQLKNVQDELRRVHCKKAQPLRYSHLYPGGLLAKSVKSFTFLTLLSRMMPGLS